METPQGLLVQGILGKLPHQNTEDAQRDRLQLEQILCSLPMDSRPRAKACPDTGYCQ